MNNIITDDDGKQYVLRGKKTKGRKRKDGKLQLSTAQWNILKYLKVLPIPGWLIWLEEVKDDTNNN